MMRIGIQLSGPETIMARLPAWLTLFLWPAAAPLLAGPRESLGAMLAGPESKTIEQSIRQVQSQLKFLPPLTLGNSWVRRGYHSTYTPIPKKPFWVILDLHEAYSIDLVALVPAQGVGMVGSGYGFPQRFHIDLSDDPEFRTYKVIARETASDYPNPGPYPYVASAGGLRARYVRVHADQRWRQADNIWLLALGEVFVVSGDRNVAAGAAVHPFGGLSTRTPPVWMEENLVDFQSDLGMPIGWQKSRTHGYCSRPETVADITKWVQVDLGRITPIDEVRLLPAHPHDSPAPGYGFPVRFRVEAADEGSFHSPVILADHSSADFLNPGDNLISIPGRGVRARFVRVTATRLHDVNDPPKRYLFALAELQVFSKQTNVALGAPVQAKDALAGARPEHIAGMYPEGPTWAPEFLVDGFTSRYRIAGLSTWLLGLSERGALDRRLAGLTSRQTELRDRYRTSAAYGGMGLAVLLAVGLLIAILSSRRQRERQLRDLRARLARDLHDEIGSSLGSIRLTSQIAQISDGVTESTLQDLRDIEQVAGSTADSMRDIIWLLDTRSVSASELINQMRDVTRRLLPNSHHTLKVSLPLEDGKLPLDFRRNVLFAFKEALYNAARHSGASEVRVEIEAGTRNFAFRINDNGCGFDPAAGDRGHGLGNICNRAKRLNGEATFQSLSGEGSEVCFRVPTP